MKKTMLAGLFALALSAVPLSSQAVQTIDSPHLNFDGDAATEDCSYCHFDFTMAVTTAYPCQSCHNDYDALEVQTHEDMSCETCHNPHVSLQYQGDGSNAKVIATGLVATDNGDGTMTFDNGDSGATPISTSFRDADFQSAATWSAKTANIGHDGSRGLVLWVPGSNGDNYSFEVISATDNQIDVLGSLPAGDALGSSIELHYGQLVSQKVSANINYKYGTGDVAFSGDFVQTGTATPNGICQVCHDPNSANPVTHWRTDGTNQVDPIGNHDGVNNLDCTRCHTHTPGVDAASLPKNGFGKDFKECNKCHGYPPASGVHELHASKYTCDATGELFGDDLAQCNTECAIAGGTCADNGNYGFDCSSCHAGGMENWHDTPWEDDQLQIGFSNTDARFNGLNFSGVLSEYDGAAAPAYPYVGTNDTAITTVNNDMSCSGIYCHSNGLAKREACLAPTAADYPSNPPSWADSNWDPQGDGNKCNNCHHDSFTDNASDTHWAHLVKPAAQLGLPNLKCANCHYGTATIDGNLNNIIADKSLHVNGQYEVQSSGSNLTWNGSTVGFTFYEVSPGSVGCSSVTCHSGRYWNLKQVACVDPVPAVSDNADPIYYGYSAYTNSTDPKSLILTEIAYDTDYLNPAKSAKYSGGHDGGSGMYQFNLGNEALRWEGRVMTDQASGFTLAHRFSDAYIDGRTGVDEGTVAAQWYGTDNNPNAISNAQQGLKPGWFDSGWQVFVMADIMVYNPMANVLPVVSYSTSNQPGTWVAELTLNALDPDYDTTDTNPSWTGVDKNAYYGAGHDGSDSLVQIFWGDDVVDYKYFSMTDIDTPFAFTWDLATDTRVTGEGQVWINYYVADNHYLNVSSTYDQLISSGWIKHVFQ